MTVRELREEIIESVRNSIDSKKLSEYLEVPETDPVSRKKTHAQVKVTSLGIIHYKIAPGNRGKQIIPSALNRLKFNDQDCGEHINYLNEYKLFANNRLDEFIIKLNRKS